MRQIVDDDRGIKELMKLCFKSAEEHGWHDKEIMFPDAIVLMHTELSEAYEEFRNNKILNEVYFNQDNPKPEGIPIELADLAIRLFHYCEYFGIDLVSAIRFKMDYNTTRPYRHGNKKS